MMQYLQQVYSIIVSGYVNLLDPPKRLRKIPITDVIDHVFIIAQDGIACRRSRPAKGSWQTYFHYYTRWARLGIFEATNRHIKHLYVSGKLDLKLSFKKLYTDTSLIKNRLGLDYLGRNPCDRGRDGNKVALICDDYKAPIAHIVYPANLADQRTIVPLVEQIQEDLIRDHRTKTNTIVADGGYTATKEVVEQLAPFNLTLLAALRRKRGTTCKPKVSKEIKEKMRGRYKIENLNCRFKQFRRLDKRYEKRIIYFKAFFDIIMSLLILESGWRMSEMQKCVFEAIFRVGSAKVEVLS